MAAENGLKVCGVWALSDRCTGLCLDDRNGLGRERAGSFSPNSYQARHIPWSEYLELVLNEHLLCVKLCVTCLIYVSSWETWKTMVSTHLFHTCGETEPEPNAVVYSYTVRNGACKGTGI